MFRAHRLSHVLPAIGIGAILALLACTNTIVEEWSHGYSQVQTSINALACASATCHDVNHVPTMAPGLIINVTLTDAQNCAVVAKLVTPGSPSTSLLITVPRDGKNAGQYHPPNASLADGSAIRTGTWDPWIIAGALCQ